MFNMMFWHSQNITVSFQTTRDETSRKEGTKLKQETIKKTTTNRNIIMTSNTNPQEETNVTVTDVQKNTEGETSISTNKKEKMSFLTAHNEVAKLLFLNAPFPVNIWLYFLAGMQFLSFFYIRQLEGIVGIVLLSCTVLILDVLYQHYGKMVRLAGVCHIGWIVVVPWYIYRLIVNKDEYYTSESTPFLFHEWVIVYTTLASISLVLDVWDVIRWFHGDHEATM